MDVINSLCYGACDLVVPHEFEVLDDYQTCKLGGWPTPRDARFHFDVARADANRVPRGIDTAHSLAIGALSCVTLTSRSHGDG